MKYKKLSQIIILLSLSVFTANHYTANASEILNERIFTVNKGYKGSFRTNLQKIEDLTANTNSSQDILHKISSAEVSREEILKRFFEKYSSPLVKNSAKFVEVADKYNLDYRLLPAIACMESSCGKFYIPSSNNVFGWGIYGNKVTSFNSIDEGIEIVGKGIYENYVLKGADTVEKMAPIYTPPNYVKWAQGVNYFYNSINLKTQEVLASL